MAVFKLFVTIQAKGLFCRVVVFDTFKFRMKLDKMNVGISKESINHGKNVKLLIQSLLLLCRLEPISTKLLHNMNTEVLNQIEQFCRVSFEFQSRKDLLEKVS
jgi:hypothetical protein